MTDFYLNDAFKQCECTAFVGRSDLAGNHCLKCDHELSLHYMDMMLVASSGMVIQLGESIQCSALKRPKDFNDPTPATAPKPQAEIEELLSEREHTHGSFANNAETYVQFTEVITSATDKDTFSDVQLAALTMICMKLARICSNPDTLDHWIDMAGYAMLAVDELESD